MPKSVIPKAENTSEIIQASLLKNTFITKRNALLRNAVPLKYRNNLKKVISQLNNERTDLVQNLNVELQISKLKQDQKNQKDILKIYNQSIQEYSQLKKYRKFLIDLNKEISWWHKKKNRQQKKLINSKLKNKNERHIFGNVEEIIATKTNWYNKGIMKQKQLRHTLDCLLKEMTFKNKIYNSIMCQLEKERRNLVGVGEEALKSYEEREKALRDLETFQDINKVEEKQRDDKMYLTKYKLKVDLGLNEFLQKKCCIRYNEHTYINNENKDLDAKIKYDNELTTFIKYLIHIGGDTDLKNIVDTIEKLNYNKDSLFRLVILYEQKFMELENSIRVSQNIAIKKTELNANRNELNDCQIKTLIDTIEKNDDFLKPTQAFTENLINLFNEIREKMFSIFQALKISHSMEQSGIDDTTFEDNMLSLSKEIENKSIEKLVIVNCIENSCTTGQNEDPLSSDAESTENLIIKDYHGIEIKMHKFLNMQDSSTLPVPIYNLDQGFLPSPCPHCMEARFIEDGYCSLLSSSKINLLIENNSQKIIGVCCAELVKHLDFKNISPKVEALLHDKSNCKKTPYLKTLDV